jgi:serine protease Do
LMTEGRVRRAYLGIAGGPRPLPPRIQRQLDRKAGVEVVEVVSGSPADRAGMRPEDLIVDLDGKPVTGVNDLQRLMVADLINVRVPVSIVRNGRVLDLELVPVELS